LIEEIRERARDCLGLSSGNQSPPEAKQVIERGPLLKVAGEKVCEEKQTQKLWGNPDGREGEGKEKIQENGGEMRRPGS